MSLFSIINFVSLLMIGIGTPSFNDSRPYVYICDDGDGSTIKISVIPRLNQVWHNDMLLAEEATRVTDDLVWYAFIVPSPGGPDMSYVMANGVDRNTNTLTSALFQGLDFDSNVLLEHRVTECRYEGPER